MSQPPPSKAPPSPSLHHMRVSFFLSLWELICLSTCYLPVSQARGQGPWQQGHCQCGLRPLGSPKERAWPGGEAGSTSVHFTGGRVRAKSLQFCLTLCNPMDCNPPGSSVHGILQARMLEWVAIPFSSGSSRPRFQTMALISPELAGRFFTTEPLGKPCRVTVSVLRVRTTAAS